MRTLLHSNGLKYCCVPEWITINKISIAAFNDWSDSVDKLFIMQQFYLLNVHSDVYFSTATTFYLQVHI